MTKRMTVAHLHALVIKQQATIELFNEQLDDLFQQCRELRAMHAELDCTTREPTSVVDLGYAQANERAKELARQGKKGVRVVRTANGFTVAHS